MNYTNNYKNNVGNDVCNFIIIKALFNTVIRYIDKIENRN